MSLTIKVPERPDDPGLFLVNFMNGAVNTAAQSKPTFTLYHAANDRTKRRRIMVAETGQLAYMGTNYDTESVSSGASVCKYYVGAVDREKGTMSLHRAELFSLKPYIPGKSDTDVSQESPSKRTKSEINDLMVSSFGSERQKRAHAAAMRNKVEAETLESALATAVTHMKEAAPELDVQSAQNSGVLPPHDATAERPQDVYNISDIISLEELKLLKRTVSVFLSATSKDVAAWREDKSYPGYVLDHIRSLPSNEPNRSLKAAFLLYASYLIQMFNFSHRMFEKKGLSMLSGVTPPTLVGDQLLEKFTEKKEDGNGRSTSIISLRIKDKILTHLLVLTLFIDDFTVDCTTLQQDLKLTTAKLTDYFRALGCQVATVKRKSPDSDSSASMCKAELSTPLKFPHLGKRKRRPA